MTTARYPAEIMTAATIPWTEDWQFDEPRFRQGVAAMLALGYRHIYIFGTAGEGYAVNDEQFLQITRAFSEALAESTVPPMVGVISLSLSTILTRIAAARELGVRHFQISLPAWGALNEDEVAIFFAAILDRFPDCQFLHYNLLRSQRLITPTEYRRLAERHPNLVATKNSTDLMGRLQGLLTEAPQLRHFLTETGFSYGSLLGSCGLLVSVAAANPRQARAYFAAGQQRDVATLVRMNQELQQLTQVLLRVVSDRPLIDGAYDKVIWKLHDPEFPLRLLPPYQSARPDAADQLRAYLQEHLPAWAPDQG